MTTIVENCGGRFPDWDFERQNQSIKFSIPEICRTCSFINACAFNALMQVAKTDEHMLNRDEAIALSGASDTKITCLAPTRQQITDLIGERIITKAGGPKRILEGMQDIAAMVENIGSSEQ